MEENVHIIFHESQNLKNSTEGEKSNMKELISIQRNRTVEIEVQEQNDTIADKEEGE